MTVEKKNEKKFDYLIVDSAGFIKNAPLESLAQNVITLREVVSEIRDKATRKRLQVLPYELQMKSPFTEDIQQVTNFSKKTGDYGSLSAVDVKVMALTLMMEKQVQGSVDHLNSEPTMQPTQVQFASPNVSKTQAEEKAVGSLVGFYKPNNDEEDEQENDGEGNQKEAISEDFSCLQYWKDPLPDISSEIGLKEKTPELGVLDKYFEKRSYVFDHKFTQFDSKLMMFVKEYENSFPNFPNLNRWMRHIQSFGDLIDENNFDSVVSASELICKIETIVQEELDGPIMQIEDDFENKVKFSEQKENREISCEENQTPSEPEEDFDNEEDGDDDDEGWITPGNIKQKLKAMGEQNEANEPQHIKVACLTADFAMQNVLIQMGLKVVSLDGMLITKQKTWLLRCYACFHVTSLMEKKFCPKCGNKTLKRVSCTLNPDGTKEIHISSRRVLTGRGKKFSLPKPIGGKHAVNPQLTEDHLQAQQRVTRLARQKTDALSEDYIAGNSPFVLHDVTSKSAIGKGAQRSHYWDAKNPNAVKRRTGNRKKATR